MQPEARPFCRDCGEPVRADDAHDRLRRCTACGSPRIVRHPELATLHVAHVDCDAFFAAVEKRERPELRNRPVIVGGGKRGVVSTACYVARIAGVRSAMPMFKALELCPHAAVVKPRIELYAAVGREVRRRMLALTPLVQPVSIDEAFLDLTGTDRTHGRPTAETLAAFAREVETELGITVSVGLSYNKFLAKFASDRDKPRGFAIIGRDEAPALLSPLPVSALPGAGAATAARLARRGFERLGDIAAVPPETLAATLGSDGTRLSLMARGIDPRPVRPERDTKSISAETTFDADLGEISALDPILWRLCERVAARLVAKGFSTAGVTLKLKTPDFALRTRASGALAPTALATRLHSSARALLDAELSSSPTRPRFRLMGVSASALRPLADADLGDLADPQAPREAAKEKAIAKLRERFGAEAVQRGPVFEAARQGARLPRADRRVDD